jgi:cell division septation protein DedD
MDKALKQRLVGASVLIVLAVIVLPMLLSGRSDTLKQESRQIELPPTPEELSIETRRFPVGLPNKPVSSVQDREARDGSENPDRKPADISPGIQSAAGTSEMNAPLPEKSEVTTAGTDSSGMVSAMDGEVVEKTSAPSTAVKTITLKSGRNQGVDIEKPAQIAADTPRYLVQVASFSSEKNANTLAGKLQTENLPVMMDVVDRVAGPLHRVGVGPYEERAEADAVVARLKAKMKDLTPRVLDLRPEDSAPVSTPSDPLVRWVVQVGSFGAADTADALVARLRLAGLSAFSEKVTSDAGTAYKVRVGPELDRDKAVMLAKKLNMEHQLEGFVTTQE